MYDIAHFKAADQQEIIDFMTAHPFIVLCGVDADHKPVATHVPCLIEIREDRIYLQAHVMRKQGHSNAFAANSHVLAIFHGPHTYVSASWYENKQLASTWNYQAVHAGGILRFLDEELLHSLLVKLTRKFENNDDSPSLVERLDEQYVRSMMKAIIAFEIEVTELQHVFKLSQNRDPKSYENIIGHLNQGDDEARAVAQTMDKRREKLRPS